MALIRSFVPGQSPGQLNRTQTVCEYTIDDHEAHGRLLVLRTYAENRTLTSSATQVYDLDLDAARRLRAVLGEVFDI